MYQATIAADLAVGALLGPDRGTVTWFSDEQPRIQQGPHFADVQNQLAGRDRNGAVAKRADS